MYLYLISTNITFNQAKYLLEHCTKYNGETCDIVEINNSKIQDIKSGYLSKLTIGKLKHQLTKDIDYYIKHDKAKIIYYLVQTLQIQVKDIFKISRYNAYRSLQVLIDQGINVNIQYSRGDTPLHWTCYKNSFESAKLLILNGANVNIQNNSGWTPLHKACCHNSVEIVKLLILNDAKKNIQDNDGDTPLHHACWNNNIKIVKLLLVNGAKKDIQNNSGNTPLKLAQINNSKDCIKLLQPLQAL